MARPENQVSCRLAGLVWKVFLLVSKISCAGLSSGWAGSYVAGAPLGPLAATKKLFSGWKSLGRLQ
jgi:hypothetical protein